MINSEDTKRIKEMVVSTLLDSSNGFTKEYFKAKEKIEKVFDKVIKEIKREDIL